MSESFTACLWNQTVYAELLEEVDPHAQPDRFRARTIGYTGNFDYWAIPSPEPTLPPSIVQQLTKPVAGGSALLDAASTLAARIAADFSPQNTLFVAILRAGAPVANWLTQLLPGSLSVATTLFVGPGIDRVALKSIRADYPNRKLIFVDGWTGKGGVADELHRQNVGPLAVLCDPWRLASYRGTTDDVFSPSACFTGPMTMGFSRTFTRGPEQSFAAYRFPTALLCQGIVAAWVTSCPLLANGPENESHQEPIRHPTDLRVHSNEVCRALINSHPETLLFADSPKIAREKYSLLIELADWQRIPQQFDVTELQSIDTRVACRMRTTQ